MNKDKSDDENNIFEGLENLDYDFMVNFIYSHYKVSEYYQGHIKFSEMKKIVSRMDHKEVKKLFENIIDLIHNYAE